MVTYLGGVCVLLWFGCQTRIQWIRECQFDVVLHENVEGFPDQRMTDSLGLVWVGACLTGIPGAMIKE